MLKRLVRHRLFQAFLVLVMIAVALGAPLRHEYLYDQYPGNCNKDCGYGQQTTTVRYGTPFAWLRLSKTTSLYDKHIVKNSTSYNTKDLGLNIGSYAAIIIVWLSGWRIVKARQHAHLGH